MADISRAVGVPTPTLYQWAARGQWRLEDMMEPVVLPAAAEIIDPDTIIDEDAEPPTALEAAQAVLELAALEGARGRLARSDQAAKLARQLFLLAEQAQRVAAAEAALHPKEAQLSEAEVEALRDSLRERLFPEASVQPQDNHPPASPAPEPVTIRRL
jgi:AcrR family transcriptional regulator